MIQCGTGEGMDKGISGTKYRAQKQMHTNTVKPSLTKEESQFNGERRVFSTNGVGTIGHLHEKQ